MTDDVVLDVGAWLEGFGLGQYGALFAEQAIDIEVLPELTETDLERFNIPLGHRKKLLKAIAALAESSTAGAAVCAIPPSRGVRPADRSAPVSSTAERRQLTVMFCDLVGSTALASRLDPEDLREVMRIYFTSCVDVVTQVGGYVAGFLGDGLLVYFGYPHAHEDAVERAARAALRLVETVRNLEPGSDIALQVRIGIATGLVVVGDLPGECAPREEVTGDTPNLARRLQELAQPDTVIVSDRTMQLLGELFELDDLGLHELKGIGGPVRAWRVNRARHIESRFDALHAASQSALFGREAEVALLLDRWRSAQGGEGQVVLLSGQAGIGKSRIAAALTSRIKDEPHELIRLQCSPFHTNTALHPIVAHLEHAAGIVPDQRPKARLEQLASFLARTGGDVSALLPLVAALLLIPTGDDDPPLNLSPEELKRRTLNSLVDWLIASAHLQPVLIILEDAHWIDPTTREFITQCIDRLESASVLLLVTHRPDFQQSWTEQASVTGLTINRLGRGPSMAMIKQIARGKLLPPEVLDQITAKADGVPLFVEEVTMTVLQSGLLREEADQYVLVRPLHALAVPSTLHDALLARLDRASLMKETAQIAAAIGREFSYALLAAVVPFGNRALEAALAQLVQGEIIHQRSGRSRRIYTFKHALMRDAAYSTLLRANRRELHARIAHTLEEQFREIGNSQPELVAHHFTEAGLTASAVEWWEKAGERALARSANLEATNHLAKALEVLASQPESTERDRREFQLRLRLRRPLYATKGFASTDMGVNFSRASLLGERLGESGKNLQLQQWQCTSSVVSASTAVSLKRLPPFIELAERARDVNAMVSGHRMCGYTLLIRGESRAALGSFKRAIALCDPRFEAGHVTEYNFLPVPMIEAMMSLALQQLGYLDQALKTCERALAAAKRAGHDTTIAYVGFHLSLLGMVGGDAHRVEREVSELLDFVREKEIPYWHWHCETLLGWARAKAGLIDAGLARMNQGVADHQSLRANIWKPFYLTRKAELLAICGKYDEVLGCLDEAEALMEELEQRYAEAEVHRLRAVTLLAKGAEAPDVEASFDRALDTARRQEAKLWELRAATSRSQFLRDTGRRRQARDLLESAYGWFTEGFDTLDLKQAKALLDSLT